MLQHSLSEIVSATIAGVWMLIGCFSTQGRGRLVAALPLLLTAACLDASAAPENVAGPQPRAAFVDARGQRWELRRHVTRFAENTAGSVHDDEPEPREAARWQDLPVEEAVRRWRPLTLTPGNYEYALADEDALQFVQRLREASGHVPHSADMSATGPEDVLSTRSGRVLSEARFPTQTFGGDDRVNLNSSASELPWVFIASMSDAGKCTAFKLINNHTAVTAAHCVHDGKDWSKRKTLQFAAGATEAKSKLDANCYSVSIPGGWDGSDADFDYAVIRLREDGLDDGALCERAAYSVGYFGYRIVDDCSIDVSLNLAGYPSQTDPDHEVPAGAWSYPTLFSDYRKDGWSGCAGVFPSTLFFYNDGSNGQSGAPVWTFFEPSGENSVRAIYRGSVTSPIGDSNRGRRLDEELVSWLTFNAGY